MTANSFVTAGALLLVTSAAQAQMPPTNFDQAAYITCKEAHAMQPEARKTLAIFLAEHASRYHGAPIPDGPQGAQVAYLVRGGGSFGAAAYPFAVSARSIMPAMMHTAIK